ncbi:MAG: hypothetical protein J7501_11265, partial [Bdellovibrio sp.]|nr:hypothetical protein [Bdellovibrio sp.]
MNTLTKSILKISFATAMLGASFAFAAEEDCLPQQDFDLILSKIRVEQKDDNGQVVKTFDQQDRCDKDDFKRWAGAVNFLFKLPRFTDIPSRFQSPVSKEGSASFLTKRIQLMQMETLTMDSCAEGASAYVTKSEVSERKMHLCPIRKNAGTPLTLGSLLLHEARHIEGYSHVHCAKGPQSELSLPACDETYQEQGSYGIGAALFFYVYKGTKNEVLKQEARSMAITASLSTFNKPPLDIKEGALILGEDSKISFYDGQETFIGELEDDVSLILIDQTTPYA